MPSVLIETGFLTNHSEEKFLLSDVGQDYLASAIYRAFKEYNAEIEHRAELINEAERKAEMMVEDQKKNTKSERKLENNSASSNEGITFMVQLATSSKLVETKPENFKQLSGVEYYEAGGLYRYTYGSENSLDKISKLQQDAIEKGFKDAFVIAFKDGKRISVNEALKHLK